MLGQIEKKSIRSKSNLDQSTDLILGKIENRLKNKGNRPNKGPNPTRTKKSKKNRPCRVKAEDIPLERGESPERFPDEERVVLTDEGEPESFEEAKNDTHNQKWLSAMQEEMDSLHENHTYELIELPRGKKALRNKWVFKLKPGDGKNPLIYKARIVLKGF